MVIYKVENLVNRKVYIGKTDYSLEHRKQEHINDIARCSKYPFQRALLKYGLEAFSWEPILELKINSPLDLGYWEKFFIDYYKSKIPNGYNLTDGGEGVSGYKWSEEAKERQSQNRIGSNNPFFGKTHSKKWKEHMALIITGRPGPNLGVSFTEDHKRKIGEANKGNKRPDLAERNRQRAKEKYYGSLL